MEQTTGLDSQNENENNKSEQEDMKKKSEADEWINSFFIAVIAAVIIRIFIFAPTIVKGPSMEGTLIDGDRLITERVSYFLNLKPSKGDIITFTEPHSAFYYETDTLGKIYQFFLKRDYIKRVIGVEGDHVQLKSDSILIDDIEYKNFEIRNKQIFINGELLTGNHYAVMDDAKVYVNDKKVEEDYIKEPWSISLNIVDGVIKQTPYSSDKDLNIDVKVEKGYVYVMGDNRNNSSDSRKFSENRGDIAAKNGCVSLKEISGRVLFRFWPFDKFGGIRK
ncbi:MAG: signal peptidase I [Deltaproteobacteria bacterium]